MLYIAIPPPEYIANEMWKGKTEGQDAKMACDRDVFV